MAAPQAWAYHTPLLLHLCQQTHTGRWVLLMRRSRTCVKMFMFAHHDPAWTLFKTSAGVPVGSVNNSPSSSHRPIFSLSSYTGHISVH